MDFRLMGGVRSQAVGPVPNTVNLTVGWAQESLAASLIENAARCWRPTIMESCLRDESHYTGYFASAPVASIDITGMEMPRVASLSGQKTLSFRLPVKFL
ncbi:MULTISPECIES: hypothetical protein [unclassified Microcoleus]|uniref:hypothetical protein n=1 Tax=unclassified Microcoleus TaxID=2642155 RepID=UPI00312B33A5